MKNMIINGTKTIDSRDVAKLVGREHIEILHMIQGQKRANGTNKHVGILPTIIEVGLAPSSEFFIKSSYKVEGSYRSYPCYLVTKKGCEMVANKMNGKQGILFTQAYVDRFNEMEQVIAQPQFKIPQTLGEALRLAADQADMIEIMQPKAEYFDALVDRNLLTNFRDTAKELKIGQKEFITWLLLKGYVFRDGRNHLKPYGEYTPTLFELKESGNEHWAGTQTLITPLGRKTFLEEMQNTLVPR